MIGGRTPGGPSTVITGIGVIAPTGADRESHWQSVLAGKSGLGNITRFDATGYPLQVVGEVDDFAVEDHLTKRIRVQTDRWTQMALVATDEALRDAGVDPAGAGAYGIGVVTASSSGGTEFGQREIQSLWSRGADHVTVYQSIAWFYAATTGQVSIRNNIQGPCGVVASEQAGGIDAVAAAHRMLGETAVVVTGGTDASLSPYGVVAQASNGRMSNCPDPARAYRPFARDSSGHVPGEGGAILIVERARASRRAYAEIIGHASGFDPSPVPGGRVLRRVVEQALRDADRCPDDVDLVFADADGNNDADRAESDALREIFGPNGVPVTAPKTLTGRLYGGGSALDIATAAVAIATGTIPPTSGVDDVDPSHAIDLVTSSRSARLQTVVVIARGYGGFCSALVLGEPR